MAHLTSARFRARYGPWALVAGASEGLGAEFATQLAARGLNLVLIARRGEVLEELSVRLTREHHIEVRPLVLDLARDDLALTLAGIAEELEIGLLVYNAALSRIGPYFETSLEDHQRELAINCHAPMTLAYLFGKRMLKRGRGGILLMSSLGGAQGSALLVNYTATKAYNRLLAEGLWDELREQGIDVLTCCPPAVSTPGYLASAPKGPMSALTPRQVAVSALDALGHGPSVIPGWSYRVANFLMQRVMPRRTTIKLMGRVTRGMYE